MLAISGISSRNAGSGTIQKSIFLPDSVKNLLLSRRTSARCSSSSRRNFAFAITKENSLTFSTSGQTSSSSVSSVSAAAASLSLSLPAVAVLLKKLFFEGNTVDGSVDCARDIVKKCDGRV